MSNVVKSFQVNLGLPFKMVQPVVHFEKIKKEETAAAPIAQDVSAEIIENARLEAEEIIANAQETAKKLLEDARIQAEEMRSVVLEEAREQGYREGHDEITAKAEYLLKEAEEIKKAAERDYNKIMNSAEKDMVDIILGIAKKVVGEALETTPEAVNSLIKQTLLKCKGCEAVILRISPEDYDMAVDQKDMILRQSGFSGELQIKKDVSLHKGGCIAETPIGSIDASADTQLSAIEEAFYDVLGVTR